jgi:alkaline phosphatase D
MEHHLVASLRSEGNLSRRSFAAYSAALGALPLLGLAPRGGAAPLRRVSFDRDPFSMGVASGDPEATSVVLWTRLAPKPFEPGGGMPNEAVAVQWQVCEDEAMRKPVRGGTARADVEFGHSVHVEVDGLQADRWYWYRFTAGDAQSPIGRTRTLPDAKAAPAQGKFAVTSCQNWEQGLFTAYEQMAKDEPDLVFHLGDYIYEYAAGRNGKVRTHHGDEIQSVDDYRMRYAQYRSDPLLQAMHARCPWLVTWDDHEVDNNYADDLSEQKDVLPVDFLIRRAHAYQAYYEMMPLRARSLPQGPRLQLFRKASYGTLAELLVLDTRQYRTDQPNGDRRSPLNDAALNRRNTLLGAPQRVWLKQALRDSKATWNVLAQQVMMGLVGSMRKDDQEPHYSMDQWPGYAHERMDLVRFLGDHKIRNPVVLTGDIHSNWCNELRVDDRRHDDPVIATEFVGTSLTSGGNGSDKPRDHDALLAANPCVKFHNRQRGYIRCTVTPKSWTSDYVVMDQVERPGGKASVRTTCVVEAGTAKVQVG